MSGYFHLEVSSRKSSRAGVILIEIKSKHHGELRINIKNVRIKRFGEETFTEVDFRILAAVEVDRSFRIDLDPHEIRDYGILIDYNRSFYYEIEAQDQLFKSVCAVAGFSQGIDPSSFIDLTNSTPATRTTDFHLGQIVALNTDHIDVSMRSLADFKYVVEEENGTTNDFGIFNTHELNPTAAYLDLGRDGYMQLRGQYQSYLEWDRDTVASPGDSDLVAVHLRQVDSDKHGWVFRSSVLLLDN